MRAIEEKNLILLINLNEQIIYIMLNKACNKVHKKNKFMLSKDFVS